MTYRSKILIAAASTVLTLGAARMINDGTGDRRLMWSLLCGAGVTALAQGMAATAQWHTPSGVRPMAARSFMDRVTGGLDAFVNVSLQLYRLGLTIIAGAICAGLLLTGLYFGNMQYTAGDLQRTDTGNLVLNGIVLGLVVCGLVGSADSLRGILAILRGAPKPKLGRSDAHGSATIETEDMTPDRTPNQRNGRSQA